MLALSCMILGLYFICVVTYLAIDKMVGITAHQILFSGTFFTPPIVCVSIIFGIAVKGDLLSQIICSLIIIILTPLITYGVIRYYMDKKKKRPEWDEYFMEMTEVIGKRSTCLKRNVGALVVKDKHILATGYNGAPRGIKSCDEIGSCMREDMKIPSGQRHELCRGLHAEQNAIVQAALHGVGIAGATIYCTHQPCSACSKMIINAGIRRIVFEHPYPDELARDLLAEAEVECCCFDNAES